MIIPKKDYKKNDIIIYQSKDGKISFDVNIFDQTVWLSQKQMADLFDRDRKTITRHISNIFKEGELNENVVCSDFEHTTQHGAVKGMTQNIKVKYYNLDVVISVGYRVKSKRGTQFRIWANQILKTYLLDGFAINEARIQAIEDKINNLSLDFRDEFRKEINKINQNLLAIAAKPVNIYNQIALTNNQNLEESFIKIIDNLLSKIEWHC